ncbi:MAG TPA: TonB family protein [Candidatus Sulfotelmatobacter sp.]|jgi:protein TonB
MDLRCLLFSSDEETAAPILEVLTALGVEAEHCSEPVATIDKVTQQDFQIVIIDWNQQPEGALLLTAARERKAAERPLTLAIVSDDISVSQALQAGANSILRKPILANQVRDTLTTARDLLRSKKESAANPTPEPVAAAAAASVLPSSMEPGHESRLRAGEFLQSGPQSPGGHFETESDVHRSLEAFSVHPVDPLSELEPTAAAMAHTTPASDLPPPPPEPTERKGLEWYLKTRAGSASPNPVQSPAAPAPVPDKPDLLDYDQTPAQTPARTPITAQDWAQRFTSPNQQNTNIEEAEPKPERNPEPRPEKKHEQKKEAERFSSMAGESDDPEGASRPKFRFKRPIIAALVLASGAIVAAPRAPWHPTLLAAWGHGRRSLRGWLNPQPATPVQAPVVHEDFARAGDEYKLPVAEHIPDATTDPSQIQVLPVIDPTIKKSNPLGGNAEPGQGDTTGATPTDQPPPSVAPPDAQPSISMPETPAPQSGSTVPGGPSTPRALPVALTAAGSPSVLPTDLPHSDAPAVVPAPAESVPVRAAAPKTQDLHYVSTPGNVPTSLKSQMASMTPDASGNKAPETAMPSIEPVSISETAERALLTDQPAIEYPVSARGQQGTVILQVLIGRDGTMLDAKFMQGSLVFARAAIDGVKLWKFKPYTMNGRPVSVQTLVTISFKPTP